MKIKQAILISLGMALLLLTVGMAAAATTYTVNNSTGQTANFTSIQDAVDYAFTGDTILVYPGTYTENVVVDGNNKQLNITSTDGADNTTIQAAGRVVEVNYGKNVTISGFTITGGETGITLGRTSYTNVTNNKVVGCNYTGILVSQSYNNRLIGNIVEDTGIYGPFYSSAGIVLSESDSNTLIGNIIEDTGISGTYYSAGIVLSGSDSNTLINNKLENNSIGIDFESTHNGNLIYNNYFNNTNNVAIGSLDDIWNSTEMVTYVYEGNTCTNYTGNYYFDYANHDPSYDTNGDGIGDTPYLEDNYPLMFWPVMPTTIVDPSDAIEILQSEISAELENPGIIKSLNLRLDSVVKSFEKGDEEKAISKLDDFKLYVTKLKEVGMLESTIADELLFEADNIKTLILGSEG